MRKSTLMALLTVAALIPGTAYAQEGIVYVDNHLGDDRLTREARAEQQRSEQDRPQAQVNPPQFQRPRPEFRVDSPELPRVTVPPPERIDRGPRPERPQPPFDQPRPQPPFTPPEATPAPVAPNFGEDRQSDFDRGNGRRFGQPDRDVRAGGPNNQPLEPSVRNDGFRNQPGFRNGRPDLRQDRRDDLRNDPNRRFDDNRRIDPRRDFPGNNGFGNDGWGNNGRGNQGWGNQGWGNQGLGNQGWGNQGWGNQGWGNQGWGNQGWGNQGRGNQGWGNQGRGNQAWGNQGWGNGGINNRWNQGRGNAWNRNWRQDNRWDWRGFRNYNRDVFHLPRYYAPNGWQFGYRRFSPGLTLNTLLFNQNYWLQDPDYYHLPTPQWPFVWVRYYNDALLIDSRSGFVGDVVNDIFWDE